MESLLLLKETEPLLDRLLELGLRIEEHDETIEDVMEFVGRVRILLTELKN